MVELQVPEGFRVRRWEEMDEIRGLECTCGGILPSCLKRPHWKVSETNNCTRCGAKVRFWAPYLEIILRRKYVYYRVEPRFIVPKEPPSPPPQRAGRNKVKKRAKR